MSAAPPTVLIADDSRVVRKAIITILGEDYSILEAEDGEQAISLLVDNPTVDILLLDLWMPDVDGFEVLETLRDSDLKRMKALPVIVITGHEDDSGMRSQAETLGAADFIGKPFSAVELRQSVQSQLAPINDAYVAPIEGAPPSIDDTHATQPVPKVRVYSAAEIRQSRESFLRAEGSKLLAEAIETQRPLTVLHLQVDRVKSLLHTTDTEFTKRSLYRIRKLIADESRCKDLLVRIGPADFVIVMPRTDDAEAREVAKIIYRTMRYTAFQYGDLKFRLSLSGGLAAHKLNNPAQLDTIFALAKVRMEKAHNSGGDQLVFEDLSARPSSAEAKLISLDETVSNLRSGLTSVVKPQLLRTLSKCLPLLVHANSTLDLDIDHAIKRIHDLISAEQG